MSYIKKSLLCCAVSFPLAVSAATVAPVEGFAHSFITDKNLASGTITILENGTKLTTDAKGHFGPIMWPVGTPLTMKFEKTGYMTTTSATFVVPEAGLTGPLHNVSFQVPDVVTFYMFVAAIGAKLDNKKCHVVATVTAHNKTLQDLPQGEENSHAYLVPAADLQPFYFGIFKDGPLKNYTNPFAKGLTATSLDGGVAFINVAPSEKPYVFGAEKPGVSFSKAQFYCRAGEFVNISPPQGPSAM